MFNPRLTETLTDFPFARLNTLLAPIAPPQHLSMINLSVGAAVTTTMPGPLAP